VLERGAEVGGFVLEERLEPGAWRARDASGEPVVLRVAAGSASPSPGPGEVVIARGAEGPWAFLATRAPRSGTGTARLEAPAERARDTVPSEPPAPIEAGARPDTVAVGGRFEVLGQLGEGGMGAVLRVRDRELGEVVALKVLPPTLAADPAALERLRREVRVARRISSPHVCRVFDLVELEGRARGLTMALVEGETLGERMRRGVAVEYTRVARWGSELADGLAAAHALGVVHRDLKPENVMIDADGRAVILDFGIARDVTEPSGLVTRAGVILGTPLYMSPEQLANRPLDGRSDLYALGLILAELVTGQVPNPGETYAELLDARVVATPRYRLRDVDPGAPPGLAAVVDHLLEPSPGERPGAASEVRDALRASLDPQPPRRSGAATDPGAPRPEATRDPGGTRGRGPRRGAARGPRAPE
jgi:serine/threonine protein kinase